MKRLAMLILVLTGSLIALPPSQATECFITTVPATFIAGFHVWGTAKEIREETNGIPGMQRRESGCTDGSVIPEDVCVIGLGLDPFNLAKCPFDFLDHKS